MTIKNFIESKIEQYELSNLEVRAFEFVINKLDSSDIPFKTFKDDYDFLKSFYDKMGNLIEELKENNVLKITRSGYYRLSTELKASGSSGVDRANKHIFKNYITDNEKGQITHILNKYYTTKQFNLNENHIHFDSTYYNFCIMFPNIVKYVEDIIYNKKSMIIIKKYYKLKFGGKL